MLDLWNMGQSAWSSGGRDNNILFKSLPEELGGKPAGVLGLALDVTLNLNLAAAGLGVTGIRAFDFLSGLTVRYDGQEYINGISGSELFIVETMMTGETPVMPPDRAIAAGAVTNQFRILVPFTDWGLPRAKDCAVPVGQLLEDGALTLAYATTEALGNANDDITSATTEVSAIMTPLDEGEAPGRIRIDVADYNGAAEFNTKSGRYRYAAVVPAAGSGGTDFTAAEMTRLSAWVGGSQVYNDVPLRTLVDRYNHDRGLKRDARLFAPQDTAVATEGPRTLAGGATSYYLPFAWPMADQAAAAVPHGVWRLRFSGTKTNYRVLTVEPEEIDDEARIRTLVAMGYDETEVRKTPAELRTVKTIRPTLGGHLNLAPRKRRILPQVWHGLKRLGVRRRK